MKYLLTLLLIISSAAVASDLPLPHAQECDYFKEQKKSLGNKPINIKLLVFKMYWGKRAAKPIGITYDQWAAYCNSL